MKSRNYLPGSTSFPELFVNVNHYEAEFFTDTLPTHKLAYGNVISCSSSLFPNSTLNSLPFF